VSAAKAYRVPRLVTCDPARATSDDPLGVIEDAAFVVSGEGTFGFVGAARDLPTGHEVVSLSGIVLPGLVDAHTHAAWVGSRHAEYALRLAGADYRAIAAAGGGIVASHRAIADATDDTLVAVLSARLRRMAALGVTTVEVKSGYGLTADLELRQLAAIAHAARDPRLPFVVPTFLGLHALPPEERAHRERYVSRVTCELLPRVAAERLATFVDAYVDANAFTVEEGRTFTRRARDLGLLPRLHVGQFADIGGAELAADVGALAADHLENVGARGIAALASAKVAAGLLPIASFTLGQAPPPVAELRRAGVPLVVASDANPGTAPTESLPLAMAFAVRTYGLRPHEAILGATRIAAESLALPARGAVREGHHADFAAFDWPHETCILQPWGTSTATLVVRDGAPIFAA